MLSPLAVRGCRKPAALSVASPYCSRYLSLTVAVVASCAAFDRGAADAFTFVPNPQQPLSHQYQSQAFHPKTQAVYSYPQHRSIHSTTALSARGRSKSSKSKSKSTSGSGGGGSTMRGVKKENLPQKVCVVCDRPFTWRKKWEKVWDEVTTCSKSCNRKRREKNRQENRRERGDGDDDEDDDDDDEEEVRSMGSGSVGGKAAADIASVGSKQSHNGEESMAKAIETMGDQIEGLDINLLAENIGQGGSDDGDNNIDEDIPLDPNARRKAERKAAKKARKAARRAEREGRGDPTAGQKQCDMCSKSVDLLVRCKHKESKGEWEMVCGKCWNVASGGVVDGDADHPDYQYGGLWKNRRAQKA